MPRKPTPWWWRERGAYYATVRGVRHRLGTSKAAAEAELNRLLCCSTSGVTLAVALDRHLSYLQTNRAKSTYTRHKHLAQSLLNAVGDMPISELDADCLEEWFSLHPNWIASTRSAAIRDISVALSWGVRNLRIASNPLKGIARPRVSRRRQRPSWSVLEHFVLHLNAGPFRDMLLVCLDTGCRPQDLRPVTARHVEIDLKRWVLHGTEAKGCMTRAVYIPTERAWSVVCRLMVQYKVGPIFRNAKGNPWTASTVCKRFKRLDGKKAKVRQYDFRHAWITEMLRRGVDSHVVATLAGHTSTAMIDKVYGHVGDDPKFMLAAAQRGVCSDKMSSSAKAEAKDEP